jgi:hypothetical protein
MDDARCGGRKLGDWATERVLRSGRNGHPEAAEDFDIEPPMGVQVRRTVAQELNGSSRTFTGSGFELAERY